MSRVLCAGRLCRGDVGRPFAHDSDQSRRPSVVAMTPPVQVRHEVVAAVGRLPRCRRHGDRHLLAVPGHRPGRQPRPAPGPRRQPLGQGVEEQVQRLEFARVRGGGLLVLLSRGLGQLVHGRPGQGPPRGSTAWPYASARPGEGSPGAKSRASSRERERRARPCSTGSRWRGGEGRAPSTTSPAVSFPISAPGAGSAARAASRATRGGRPPADPATDLPAGEWRYLLVRGRNACGAKTQGAGSAGERATPAPP